MPGDGANVLFNDGGTGTLDFTGAEPQLGIMTVKGDWLTIPDVRINLDARPPKQGTAVDLVIENNGYVTLSEDSILAATNLVQIGGFAGGELSAGYLGVGDYSGGWSSGIQVYDGTFSLSGAGVGWDVCDRCRWWWHAKLPQCRFVPGRHDHLGNRQGREVRRFGIGDSDTMDLKGFAFGSGVTDTFSNGTLTLHSDSGTTKLLLPGTHTASEFTFAKDAGGGTVISFHHT